MTELISRRFVLSAVPALGATSWAELLTRIPRRGVTGADTLASFPSHEPELVREVVAVAHGNFDRLRQLVAPRPALARASWDWGFGDWESALGAAAHVGRRDIAEFLIEHGARPTMFSAAMMGQLETVRGFVAASPGVQHVPGPHGITLLAHARAGGAAAAPVAEYLESVGDAEGAPGRQPLPDKDRDDYVGEYVYGSAEDERLEVFVNDRGWLLVRRPGHSARALRYVGDDTFFPAGAQAVRLRFQRDRGRVVELTVLDPEVLVSALRVGP